MIIVEVKVTYRDDKVKTFDCSETPYVGSDYLTLYPIGGSMKRKIIPASAIAEIEWEMVYKK